MSNEPPSRFVAQNKTTHERLSTNTVGLVALSDFRKRRAEVIEQQEREARDSLLSPGSGPSRSLSHTPAPDSSAPESGSGAEQPAKKKLKKKKRGVTKLSFGSEDEDEGDDSVVSSRKGTPGKGDNGAEAGEEGASPGPKTKLAANASVGIVPKALTKASMRHEAAERERLRREFLQIQDAVKATDIAIPFVFYDGTNTPGGTVRLKKGDYVWVFLDKSRKVGAELSIGGDKLTARKQWARVGVDDLMLVRGTMIIPHVRWHPLHPTKLRLGTQAPFQSSLLTFLYLAL